MAVIGAARPANAASIRTPLFILGVALALVAFLVMFAFGLFFANKAGNGTTLQIVVAKEAIPARDPITVDMLQIQSWPANSVSANAYTGFSQLAGQYAIVDIFKGQPLTANVVTANPNDLPARIPHLPLAPGYVALTLPTSEQQFVGGYPAQSDFVNVVVTADTTKFTKVNPRTVTVMVFTNVYIVRTGMPSPVASSAIAPAGVPSSVTVEMTPCDAALMTWLDANTTIKYELVSRENYPSPPKGENPACPYVQDRAITITPAVVDAKWHFTTTS